VNIIGKRNWYFALSLLVIAPGIVALLLWGLKVGIDFKGGSLLELEFSKKTVIKTEQIKKLLNPLKIDDLQVQSAGANKVIIKSATIDKDKASEIKKVLLKIGTVKENRFETIGPVVGRELARKAIMAVILASIVIVLYIAYAFRKVPKPASSWRFGVTAVIALLHDVLVVVGAFSILGHFRGLEVDSYFITALLTVLGFSVHDTIVVFDRIRENLRRYIKMPFEQVVNESIVQTLSRSINTSLTVIITLTSLYLLGGSSTKPFILALLIGIISGTYSSIFNASPLLVVWQNFATRKR